MTLQSDPPQAAAAAAALGVEASYRDARRVMRDSLPSTVAAIAAMLEAGADDAAAQPALVLRRNAALPAEAREILTEDGRVIAAPRRLGPSIPYGYHRLVDNRGNERELIVSPGRCHLPDDLDGWGLAVQLYAARSRSSWGVGDLGDLATISDWSARRGARFLLVTPLHAPLLTEHLEPSPYFASSRLFRNPLYIRVEDVPDAARLAPQIAELARRGHELNSTDLIDRDRAWALKREALEAIWAETQPTQAFESYCAAAGPALTRYAQFCVLTELFGPGWRRWPAEYRHPENQAVAEISHRHADRIQFHAWLQWLLETQLRSARPQGMAIMHDLAVGVNPDGADCWSNPDVFVEGFCVGAPPDRFNTLGQNWGQPPFHPFRLRNAGYRPYIEMFRAIFAGGGAVRIDHIMGLFRLWWIPDGAAPGDGAYVRYPASELLDLLALESHRSGAFVVGEDLGTVEQGVRPILRQRNILSYRLLLFGGSQPLDRFPRQAMTAVTTHDLPTIAGTWTRSDVAAQRERGLAPNESGMEATRQRLVDVTGASETTPLDEVVVAAHAALAQAPSQLISAALEDVAVTELRPNMPGTVAPTWPNWQIPLPQPLEDVLASQVAEDIARALTRDAPTAADRGGLVVGGPVGGPVVGGPVVRATSAAVRDHHDDA